MFIFNVPIPQNLAICTKNLILATATKLSPKQFSHQQEHKFYHIFLNGQQLEVE
jgi:fructose-specific phosphotransferase system IIC component